MHSDSHLLQKIFVVELLLPMKDISPAQKQTFFDVVAHYPEMKSTVDVTPMEKFRQYTENLEQF